jgi:hypothetical protein
VQAATFDWKKSPDASELPVLGSPALRPADTCEVGYIGMQLYWLDFWSRLLGRLIVFLLWAWNLSIRTGLVLFAWIVWGWITLGSLTFGEWLAVLHGSGTDLRIDQWPGATLSLLFMGGQNGIGYCMWFFNKICRSKRRKLIISARFIAGRRYRHNRRSSGVNGGWVHIARNGGPPGPTEAAHIDNNMLLRQRRELHEGPPGPTEASDIILAGDSAESHVKPGKDSAVIHVPCHDVPDVPPTPVTNEEAGRVCLQVTIFVEFPGKRLLREMDQSCTVWELVTTTLRASGLEELPTRVYSCRHCRFLNELNVTLADAGLGNEDTIQVHFALLGGGAKADEHTQIQEEFKDLLIGKGVPEDVADQRLSALVTKIGGIKKLKLIAGETDKWKALCAAASTAGFRLVTPVELAASQKDKKARLKGDPWTDGADPWSNATSTSSSVQCTQMVEKAMPSLVPGMFQDDVGNVSPIIDGQITFDQSGVSLVSVADASRLLKAVAGGMSAPDPLAIVTLDPLNAELASGHVAQEIQMFICNAQKQEARTKGFLYHLSARKVQVKVVAAVVTVPQTKSVELIMVVAKRYSSLEAWAKLMASPPRRMREILGAFELAAEIVDVYSVTRKENVKKQIEMTVRIRADADTKLLNKSGLEDVDGCRPAFRRCLRSGTENDGDAIIWLKRMEDPEQELATIKQWASLVPHRGVAVRDRGLGLRIESSAFEKIFSQLPKEEILQSHDFHTKETYEVCGIHFDIHPMALQSAMQNDGWKVVVQTWSRRANGDTKTYTVLAAHAPPVDTFTVGGALVHVRKMDPNAARLRNKGREQAASLKEENGATSSQDAWAKWAMSRGGKSSAATVTPNTGSSSSAMPAVTVQPPVPAGPVADRLKTMENELDLRLQKLELSLQANLEKRIEAMQLEVKTAGEAQTRAIAEVKQRQDSDQTVLTTMQKLLEQVAQTQMAQQQDSQAIKQTLEKVANTMASPAAKANGDGAEGRSRSPKGR